MSYAIIGFGQIGHALAKAVARKGIEVSVATTRDPESFAADAAAIGPKGSVSGTVLAMTVRVTRRRFWAGFLKGSARFTPTYRAETVFGPKPTSQSVSRYENRQE